MQHWIEQSKNATLEIATNTENILMPQTNRSNGGVKKPKAYWQTIQERIDCAKAVKVLNESMEPDADISEMQFKASVFIVNKMLPSLQAVAVQVHESNPATRGDIDALMTTSGLNPALIWDTLEAKPEPKAIAHEENSNDNKDLPGPPYPASGT